MADKIFYNGKIYTQAGSVASAIAVAGNRIQAVGTDQELCSPEGENCEMVDLRGRCVLPGFCDSHCHVLLAGLEYEKIPLRGARSIEEVIERGKKFIEERKIPAGTWVIGSGYDHNIFPEQRQPERKDLDRISRVHPVMIERVCGHIGAANTLALAEAGFHADTVIEGEGGIIGKDADGEMNGVLVETALDVFKRNIPKADLAQAKRAILRVFEEVAAYGVTSMHTDDLEGAPLDIVMQAYRELRQEGKATVRIWEEVQKPRLPVLEEFLASGLRTGDGDEFFKIGNIKLITDGSLGARTALMREDYSDDPGNRGVGVYTQEELNEIVRTAHRAGMQVACHAIGDGAIAQCTEALSRAYLEDGADLRNRIVHCQFTDEELRSRMAEGHICADAQPSFVVSDLPLVYQRIGERAREGYAWKSMLDKGIHVGGGSDGPVETFNAVQGIHDAVNRASGEGQPSESWNPEEKLTVEEAVRMYTSEGAFLSLEEDIKGTLEPGKLADFVVLDKNIYEIPPETIHTARCVMTVMDGRIIYRRD